jgi:hypothetical protein
MAAETLWFTPSLSVNIREATEVRPLQPHPTKPVPDQGSLMLLSSFYVPGCCLRATLPLILITAATALAAAPQTGPPIPAKRVSFPKQEATLEAVVAALTKQTGYAVDLTAVDGKQKRTFILDNQPLWQALESIAAETSNRVVVEEQRGKGLRIRLERLGEAKSAVWVDGPFRFSAREVAARLDLGGGESRYDLVLDICWEPRFEVFRIDSQPTITKAADDTGKALTIPKVKAFNPVVGYTTASSIHVRGLTRKAARITELEGSFTVTATPEMLPFSFTNLNAGKPITEEKNGVKVTLRPPRHDVKLWSVALELHYPPGGPVFESFEDYWLRANELTFVSPQGKRYPVGKVEIDGSTMTYRLEETDQTGPLPKDLQGWKLEFTTPAPLREFAVRFRLREIPLP